MLGAAARHPAQTVVAPRRPATRIAAGDPELWLEIIATNRANIVRELATLEHTVAEIRRVVEHKQYEALSEILREAKQKRDAVGS